ncbi:2'-5' RNA ligase family protein [Nocardioides panacisoli]|uniref:2'-5' RNA ligase family protein n=1 Tax=Nocardioides panacisoli TaxID=627624 RepID=UPI001C634FE3|nr:2'-5' RNA ligase family protein [Nocardioides panacisoli]QYJ05454.1 2'-5' RNA ligase family protein [Nocardioides panacisoli]
MSAGHHVLVVPVPELEGFVRGRWHHHAPAWVASDPAFTHAHVTALAPFTAAWARRSGPPAPERLAAVAAVTAPFDFTLAEVAAFPNGCLHLPPEPSGPFTALTDRLVATYPGTVPYGGRYDAVPHLTLDHEAPGITLDSTRAALGDLLPVTCRAERLELHWYEEGNCHVRGTWPLGG